MEITNNQVTISGEICEELVYSHSVYGDNFYMTTVKVERLSDNADYLPVMVSDRLLSVDQKYSGMHITIEGQFRSYNSWQEGKSKLLLYVFAREITFNDMSLHKNSITLDGFICKKTIYRRTPKGRHISDLMVAVNRPYGKSDYIPCICWGRNAMFASGFYEGYHVQIEGRIQSREYGDEKKIAYEVSASKVEVIYN